MPPVMTQGATVLNKVINAYRFVAGSTVCRRLKYHKVQRYPIVVASEIIVAARNKGWLLIR